MSVCTKCGYPVGNHPFRHPFAPVMAEALKPPAPESPYVPLHCGVGDLGELRTRNAALLAEVERLRTEHRQMFDQLSDTAAKVVESAEFAFNNDDEDEEAACKARVRLWDAVRAHLAAKQGGAK